MAESRQGVITSAVSCLAHLPEDHRGGEAFHIPAELKEKKTQVQASTAVPRPAPLLPVASSQTTRAQKGHRGTLTTCQASRLQISNHHPLFPRSDRPGVSWGLSQRAGFPSRIHFLVASGRSGGHSSGQVLSGRILRLEEAGLLTGGPSLRPCSVQGEAPHTLLQGPAGVCLCPLLQRRSCCSSAAPAPRRPAAGAGPCPGGQARPQLAASRAGRRAAGRLNWT